MFFDEVAQIRLQEADQSDLVLDLFDTLRLAGKGGLRNATGWNPDRPRLPMTVDVATMPDLYDDDQDFEVADLIDDPVIPLPDAVTIVARELLAARWSGIL